MKKILKELLKDLIESNINNIKISGIKKFNNISEYEFFLMKAKLEFEKNNKTDLYFKLVEKYKVKENIFCYWSLIYDEECKKYHVERDDKVIITELGVQKDKTTILLEIEDKDTEILKYGTILYFIDFVKFLEENTDDISKNIIKDLEKLNKTTLLIGIKLNNSINHI